MEIKLTSLHHDFLLAKYTIATSTPEEYYRICLYNEFLSHVLAELEERFVNPSFSVTLGLFNLVPTECVRLGFVGSIPEDLAKAVEFFKSDLPHAHN